MTCKSINKNYFLAFIVLLISHIVDGVCRGGRILKSGITEEEKRLILEEHNFLRQTVAVGNVRGQPAAQNMQEMVWDDELAVRAQLWASECTFAHDPSRYVDRFIMGQNVGLLWSTTPLADDDGDFPSRVRNWFNEVQKYAWGAKWSVKTGHYSQLVWGDTNLVGCGFTYYQELNNRRLYNKIYVCNYGPGGNVLGAKPYQTGLPKCRNFGMSDSAKYPGLCKQQYNENHVEQRIGNEYADLEFNSINDREGDAGQISAQQQQQHYTYKTYNGEYENKRIRNNANSYVNRNYNRISDNEAHSFVKRHQQTQQQYNTNGAALYPQQQQLQQQQYQQTQYQKTQLQQFYHQQQQPNYQATSFQQKQTTPFLRAFQQQQQQHNQKRPIDRSNPFQTYRWDQLFKNHV